MSEVSKNVAKEYYLIVGFVLGDLYTYNSYKVS